MQNPTIGFIGGGRIVSIFLAGWKRAGAMPADIMISEPTVAEACRNKLTAVMEKIKP